MPNVKVQRCSDLASASEDHLHVSGKAGSALAAIEYSTMRAPPDWADSKTLVADCCEAAKPLADGLFAEGFRLWMLRVDIERTPEMKKRWPNYTLANQLEQEQLLHLPAVSAESVLSLSGSERRAGLFLIAGDKLFEACLYLTHNPLSIAILSQRENFLCAETLALAYKVAAFDDNGERYDWMNWRALAAAFCPLGDVVIKTIGRFDDRERAVIFVLDSRRTIL